MEMQREVLNQWDLINAGSQRHGEAWDRLRQLYVDYNLHIPTYTEVFQHSKAQSEAFEQARDEHGRRWDEVALWLMLDVAPRLGLPSDVFDPDVIQQIVIMPRGGILNIEGGYFIRLPDEEPRP